MLTQARREADVATLLVRATSVTEGEIEGMGRGGMRPQQLLDDIKKKANMLEI